MSIPPESPVPPVPPAQSQELREMMTFLREENAATRLAVHEESEAARQLLEHYIKIISYPVTVALFIFALLIAVIGWRSFQDVKSFLRTEGEAEIQSEVTRMQKEVRDRLSDKFKEESIQKSIQAAAQDAATKQAGPLIRSEVSRQVKETVAVEQDRIRKYTDEQVSNEFYRIRDFTATLEVLFPKNVENPNRFSMIGPTVLLARGNPQDQEHVAEFALRGPQTLEQNFAWEGATHIGLVAHGQLHTLFMRTLLGKRIHFLNGIDAIVIQYVDGDTDPMKRQQKAKLLLDFSQAMESLIFEFRINGVLVRTVTAQKSQIQPWLPTSPEELIQGTRVSWLFWIEIPNTFTDVEGEYKRQSVSSK